MCYFERILLQLAYDGNIYYLEVKGVTLEDNGLAKFPDAVVLAKEKGVDLFAYNCEVYEDEINLKDEVNILM